MAQNPPHARAFDLPGWPCPPRVRDIPTTSGSWGWVSISSVAAASAVLMDELGYLWVDGDKTPKPHLMTTGTHTGAYAYWTERGVALYVNPNSYKYLPNISRLDMPPDRYLPVVEVAQELPEFAK